jgi:integrase
MTSWTTYETRSRRKEMARPPTGSVVERPGKKGVTYALRFRAYGQRRYVTLEVATRAKAQEELENVLADVRRGIWRPPADPIEARPEEAHEPTLHRYASEWVERRRHEVDERTVEHWRWALAHVLEFFAEYRPSQITGRLVDQYKLAKLREREQFYEAHARKQRLDQRGLGPGSINKTLKILSQVLDDAIEDGYLMENPARGKRRRLKASKPRRTWLELDEVRSLIDGAGETHRALIATMILSGLRVSELTGLRWRDVDLASGRLQVADSKTDAGRRTVDLSPDLRDELLAHKAKIDGDVDPAGFVFATRNGTARLRSNVSWQILGPATAAANDARVKAGLPPIKSDVTNHSLRRTFASLLYEAGASPAYVMAQMGHESSALALEVYAKVMERKRDVGARMDQLVRGAEWTATAIANGTGAAVASAG